MMEILRKAPRLSEGMDTLHQQRGASRTPAGSQRVIFIVTTPHLHQNGQILTSLCSPGSRGWLSNSRLTQPTGVESHLIKLRLLSPRVNFTSWSFK